MKRIFVTLIFLALATLAHAQNNPPNPTCSPNNPCVAITGTDSSFTATVIDNASGVEISGPGYVTVWQCIPSTTVICNASTIGTSAWVALGPGSSTTNALAGTVGQTSQGIQYTEQPVAYSTTYDYYLTATWNGGGPSAPSAIFQVALGAAPVQTPAIPVAPAAAPVTSGTYGNTAP